VLGFDTGPGNTLLDYWVKHCHGLPFDDGGQWASTGQPDRALLAACLDDPYFALSPPKSTGREYFNAAWLADKLAQIATEVSDVNVAATLLELTAQSLVAAIRSVESGAFEFIVCGGGAKNSALMQRIGALAGHDALTTAEFGLDPDYVEAALMAWLAHARVHGRPGNVPTVTAAREAVTLGALYSGDRSQN
jgi:anhydro-N-acetylmuramic acid kinase